MKKFNDIERRNAPVQGRSKERSEQIINATANLLDRLGFDDLNTVLIAKEVGISIGSLYHYFPNKQAILFAMGQRWLAEVEVLLKTYDSWDIENIQLDKLIFEMLSLNFSVYKKQKAILTLVQAMYSVPELRDLDEYHDKIIISGIANILKRLGVKKQLQERERIGRIYLETSHAVFISMTRQNPQRCKRSFEDLQLMIGSLFRNHLSSL